MATLGDVANFVNGFAFKPGDWQDDGHPIIRIQNLTDPTKPFNRTTRDVAKKYYVEPGDILVSWSASLGVFTWDRAELGLVNQHIFRVNPDHAKVTSNYLRHMLAGALVDMERHLHGATMKHVNRGEFLATQIPLPSLDEQCRIAAILDQADALRVKRCQALANLDDLSLSIFHSMFGGIGDPRWERLPLGDVVSAIDNGTSPNCEARAASDAEVGILKLGAVTYGVFRAHENKAYLEEVGSMRSNEVRPGDVLMTRKNTRELVGAVALVDEVRPNLLLSDLIFRLALDESRIDRRYFQALMMNPGKRPSVRDLSSGSAASMPNISKARLRQLQLELPPISLQREFAARMEQINSQRATMQKCVRAEDDLFSSLQHRAFQGELR